MNADDDLSTPPLFSLDPSGTIEHTEAYALGQDKSRDEAAAGKRKEQTRRAAPVLPGYEIVEELGRGGMGVVYKARQTGLKRFVALKMILAGAYASPQQIARFRAEAEAVARLQHPNIVQIYDIGEHEDLPYFSLEYVEGGSLNKVLAAVPQPARVAAKLVATLAEAMEAAHQTGLVHRDLKPSNILLMSGGVLSGGAGSSGVVSGVVASRAPSSAGSSSFATHVSPLTTSMPKITDFGLAKQLDLGADGPTASGTIMGTPSYMAPEQAEGRTRDIGPRTDIYGLGTILYEMLTGRPPFRAATSYDTVMQVIQDEPVPPRRLQPKVPRDLETICLKCLHKDLKRRYATAQELADDLKRFLNYEPIKARAVGVFARSWRWCRRFPSRAALIAVTLLGIVTLVGLGFWFSASLGAADARAKANQDHADQLKVTHEFFRRLSEISERRFRGEPGWTWQNLDGLQAALADYPDGKAMAEVRQEAVAAAGAIDVRLKQTAGKNMRAAALAFSPDAKTLALAQERPAAFGALGGCLVLLVDPVSGQKRRQLSFPAAVGWQLQKGHPDGARSMAFSPDGSWLVVGARSGMLHRWDLRLEKPPCVSWKGHAAAIQRLLFDREGQALFSFDSTALKRWRTEGDWLSEVKSFDAKGLDDFDYNPANGTLLLAGDAVHRLDAEFLFPLQSCPKKDGAPLRFFAQGRGLALASGKTLRLAHAWDDDVVQVFNRPEGDSAHLDTITHIALSHDETLLASSSVHTHDVRLWDMAGGRHIASLSVPGGMGNVAFSPDDRILAVAAESETQLYEIGRDRVRTTRALGLDPVMDVCPLEHGIACLERARHQGALTLWTQGALRPFTTLPADHVSAERLAVDEARQLVALGLEDKLAVVPLSPDKISAARLERLADVCFTPDGRLWSCATLNVAAWQACPLKQELNWDNRVGDVLTGKGGVNALQAGSIWAVGAGRDGSVHVFRTQPPQHYKSVPVTGNPLISVALGPEGRLAAFGSERGELIVVNLPEATVLARAEHANDLTGVAFLAPDLVASGGHDRTIRLWRIEGQKLHQKVVLPCAGPVRRLKASVDGRQLWAVLEGERAVRVWHVDKLWQTLRDLDLALDWRVAAPHAEMPAAELTFPPDGPGLSAELFRDDEFQVLLQRRIDPNIQFRSPAGAPGALAPSEKYSIRWHGWLAPAKPGRYLLALEYDEEARLWLDGKLLVDAWTTGAGAKKVEVDLADGPHRLRLDYRNVRGGGHCLLSWTPLHDNKPGELVPIPAGALFTSRAAALAR